jgi:hypothetical protein
MLGLNDLNRDAVAVGDEAVRTLMVCTDVPHCGQLNIANPTLSSKRLSVLKEKVAPVFVISS